MDRVDRATNPNQGIQIARDARRRILVSALCAREHILAMQDAGKRRRRGRLLNADALRGHRLVSRRGELQHEERPANLDLIAIVQPPVAGRQAIDEAGVGRIEIAHSDTFRRSSQHAVPWRYG